MSDSHMSRRQFMKGFGLAGLGTATVVAGGGVAGSMLLLANNRRKEATESTAVDSTAQPSPTFSIERPNMISREQWGALPTNHNAINEKGFYSSGNPEGWYIYEGDLKNHYQTVVIHHAAWYEEDDVSTLLEVQRLHRETRAWADVAYHFFIGKSGAVYEGREMAARGAHVSGYNTGSVGVCFLGNYMVDQVNDLQVRSVNRLLRWLATELSLTHLDGHRSFNANTVCPGIFLIPYLPQFAEQAGLNLGTDGYIPLPEPTTDTTTCYCCVCRDMI